MLLLHFQRATFFLFLITPSYWILTIEAISKTGRGRSKAETQHTPTGFGIGPVGNANITRLQNIALSSASDDEAAFVYGSVPIPGTNTVSPIYPVGPIDTTGFCLRRREMKLLCYCTPDEETTPVFKAECWIFVEGLLASDPTWTRFWQQKRIRELKLVVQKHGFLNYIPTFVFDALRNITIFSIEYAQIERIKTAAFNNLAYLERIYLGNNMIINVEESSFHTLLRLTEINFEYNQLRDIHPHAFRNLPALERLILAHNNITQLHESMFAQMPHMLKLDLSHNHITLFGSEAFKGLGNLHVLNLSSNLLTQIGDTVFIELWSLNTLNLSENKIQVSNTCKIFFIITYFSGVESNNVEQPK